MSKLLRSFLLGVISTVIALVIWLIGIIIGAFCYWWVELIYLVVISVTLLTWCFYNSSK